LEPQVEPGLSPSPKGYGGQAGLVSAPLKPRLTARFFIFYRGLRG